MNAPIGERFSLEFCRPTSQDKRNGRMLAHASAPMTLADLQTATGSRAVRPDQRMAFDADEPDATQEELDDLEKLRPATRQDCAGTPRPCPFVGCEHHVFLSVSPKTGGIKYHHESPWDLPREASCVLDLADAGEMEVREIAKALGTSHQRVTQLEQLALTKLETKGLRLRLL